MTGVGREPRLQGVAVTAGDGRLPNHRSCARERRLSWLLLALQVILSAVLLVAATEKTLRAEEFFAALRLSHLPAGSIVPIGVAVPALELTLALALLLAPARWLPLAFGSPPSSSARSPPGWAGCVRAGCVCVAAASAPAAGTSARARSGATSCCWRWRSRAWCWRGRRDPRCRALAGDGRHRDVPRPLPGAPARAARAWPHLILSFEQYQARQTRHDGELK